MGTRDTLLGLVLVSACAVPRPARFASAPAVTRVADDQPCPMPRRDVPVQEFELTEAYVRRPLVSALDPARIAEASDINALDDVPTSSWFAPDDSWLATEDAAPEAPFSVLPSPPESGSPGLSVVDASGRRFELRHDPADRPEMRTAAAAVASRIFARLGYFVAPTWVSFIARDDLRTNNVPAPQLVRTTQMLSDFLTNGPAPNELRFRVSATRWPIGRDLGPTRAFGTRPDDPNDRVPHEDRRTLRAFAAIFPWLGSRGVPRAFCATRTSVKAGGATSLMSSWTSETRSERAASCGLR